MNVAKQCKSQVLQWFIVASLESQKWSHLSKVLLDIELSACASLFFSVKLEFLGDSCLFIELFKFKWRHFCVLANLFLCGTKHCLLHLSRLFQPHYLKVLEWLAKFKPLFILPSKKIWTCYIFKLSNGASDLTKQLQIKDILESHRASERSSK